VGLVRLIEAAELSERVLRRVEHAGRAVAVGLADGRPQAVQDRCPHREVALSGGIVADGVVTCPGHFRRFDLRTGQCLSQPGEAVGHYECVIAGGWVEADLGTPEPHKSLREMLLAHARERS
jgi:nitrite reductase/ring-hydroxylating ferredoxin subunit